MSKLDLQLYQISDQTPAFLREHVIEPLLLRVTDPAGGFHEHFDASWNKIDNDSRSLVFQSRIVWTACACAELFPDLKDRLYEVALHGMTWLRDHQWDEEFGGFYWTVDSKGEPTTHSREEKNAYGLAFAMYGLAEMARVFGDADALNLAVRTFVWFDHHARDKANLGYFESLQVNGNPYEYDHQPEVKAKRAWVETARGFKSFNTHLHLLEAFSTLAQAWDEPTVEQRVSEILHLVKTKMYVEPGCFHGHFTADWQPVPSVDSYGHDMECAFLMLEAAGLSEDSDPLDTADKARRAVDHALDVGVDPEHGGVYLEGDAFGRILRSQKTWWVQFEALNALATMHSLFGVQTDHYGEALVSLWEFVTRFQTDHERKGLHAELTREGTVIDHAKADPWTEGYHQTRALINLHRLLAPQNII